VSFKPKTAAASDKENPASSCKSPQRRSLDVGNANVRKRPRPARRDTPLNKGSVGVPFKIHVVVSASRNKLLAADPSSTLASLICSGPPGLRNTLSYPSGPGPPRASAATPTGAGRVLALIVDRIKMAGGVEDGCELKVVGPGNLKNETKFEGTSRSSSASVSATVGGERNRWRRASVETKSEQIQLFNRRVAAVRESWTSI
jgi:hypothetical protein